MKILRILMNRIGNLWQSRAKRRKVVTVLACIVVFTTVYALIMPAITLTQKAASEMAGINIEETAIVGEITAETEQNADYRVAINVDAKAGIPAGTTAEVREILPDSKDYDYKILYEKAQEAVTAARGKNFDIRQIHLYTLNLLNEGEEIQPEAPVKVRFSYNKGINLFERDLLTAISLPVNEEGTPKNEKGTLVAPEIIMPESEDNGADAESATFKMSEISMIAVAELEDVSAGTLYADGEDYSITIQYGKDAGIPMGSVLSVSEIGQDTEEYQEYYAKAAETVSAGSLDFARFFDVTISYDGEKLEPEAPVSVQISYDAPLEVSEEQEVQAIHFAESNGVETPELLSISDKSSEMQGSMERVTDITFRQESFSVIGSIVAASSSNYYWPSPDNSNLVMVVTPDNTNYYAVKHDGALTAVTYSNGNVIFSEADGFTSVSDLSDYYWNIVNSSYNKRKFISDGSGHYLMPYYSYTSGNLTGNTQRYSLYRDSHGHVYYRISSQGYYYYYYLKINSTNTTIDGGEYSNSANNSVSHDACAVYFADNFSVGQEESVWPSNGSNQYMVVTADNTAYYAVKKDGSLIPITIEDRSGVPTVVFDSSSSVTTNDLNNFKWNLTQGSDSNKRQIASSNTLSNGNTAYISPTSEGGIVQTSGTYLSRDEIGHIYIMDVSGNTPYHYLGINSTTAIMGNTEGTSSSGTLSLNACGVAFYGAADINESGSGGGGTSGGSSDPLGQPVASKTLTDNNDGTYDLALSVTGKTESLEEESKVDVYIIFDTSGSMITNYVTYTENGVEQEKLRLDVAKSAIQSTAHALFSQNGQNGLADDAIRITLIPFNNNATIKAVTTSEQTITEQLNSITYYENLSDRLGIHHMKLLRKLMDRIQEGWQRKATRRKAITVLACFVVFTTVYALIMPAITLTQKAASAMGGIGLEESAFAGELTAETEENAAFKAFVKVGEGAIPEGTTVEVREILPDSKDYDYKLWYEKAQEAVTEDRGNNFDIRQIHLYTINLLNEGVKVEPEAPLEISFNYEKGLSIFDRSLLTAISLPVNEEGKPKDEKGKLVAPEKIMPDAEDKGTDAESITTPVTIVYTDGTYKILFASDSNVTEDTLPDYQWNLTPDDSDSKKRTIASSDGTQYIWPEDAVGRTSTNMGSLSLDDQGHLYTTTSNGTQFHYLGMTSGADNAKTLKGDATGTGSNTEVSTSACAVSFYDVALTDVSFESSIVEEVSDNWPSVTYSVGIRRPVLRSKN